MLYDLNIDSIQAGTIYGRQEWLQKFAALKNSIIEAINDNGKDSLKYLYHIYMTQISHTPSKISQILKGKTYTTLK